MKTVIRIFSDLQIDDSWPDGHVNDEGINFRLQDIYNATSKIWERPFPDGRVDKLCVFCGDWFESRKPSALVKDFSERILRNLSAHFDSVLMIPGNHDWDSEVKKSKKVFHNLSLFNLAKNVGVHSEGGKLISFGGISIYAVPFMNDLDLIKEKIDGFEYDKSYFYRLLILHCDIAGAMMPSVLSKAGLSLEYMEGLTKKFNQIFVGHYHNKQRPLNNDKLIIPGSILPLKLDEAGCDHGFYEVVTDGVKATTTFVKTDYPEYLRLDWSTTDVEEEVVGKKLSGVDVKDKIVRLIVKDTPENIASADWDRIDNTFKNAGVYSYRRQLQTKRSEVSSSVDITASFEEMSLEYMFRDRGSYITSHEELQDALEVIRARML